MSFSTTSMIRNFASKFRNSRGLSVAYLARPRVNVASPSAAITLPTRKTISWTSFVSVLTAGTALAMSTSSSAQCEGAETNGSADPFANTKLFPPIKAYETGMLRVSDIHRISYSLYGNPNGKPVLFVHGGPGGGTDPAMARYFDPKVYKVVLVDQRGCGDSTPFADLRDNTTYDSVRDFEKLRVKLGIKKWQVFGGSWGSTLALAYAVSNILLSISCLWLIFIKFVFSTNTLNVSLNLSYVESFWSVRRKLTGCMKEKVQTTFSQRNGIAMKNAFHQLKELTSSLLTGVDCAGNWVKRR